MDLKITFQTVDLESGTSQLLSFYVLSGFTCSAVLVLWGWWGGPLCEKGSMSPNKHKRESIDWWRWDRRCEPPALVAALQPADLHVELGDHISRDEDSQHWCVCVFVCSPVCIWVWQGCGIARGWLTLTIIPVLGNTAGIRGRFSLGGWVNLFL